MLETKYLSDKIIWSAGDKMSFLLTIIFCLSTLMSGNEIHEHKYSVTNINGAAPLEPIEYNLLARFYQRRSMARENL